MTVPRRSTDHIAIEEPVVGAAKIIEIAVPASGKANIVVPPAIAVAAEPPSSRPRPTIAGRIVIATDPGHRDENHRSAAAPFDDRTYSLRARPGDPQSGRRLPRDCWTGRAEESGGHGRPRH